MRKRRPTRPAALLTLGLLALAGGPITTAQTGTPTPAAQLRVTDVRTVTLHDARIISMSPDGSWLVATVPAVGYNRGELCVYALETLAPRSCADISGFRSGIRLEDVTWSPDGRSLAFGEHAFRTLWDGDLWLMDAETGALTNLDDDGYDGSLPVLGRDVPGTVSVPVSPAFSPDGRLVAYSRSLFVDGERRGTSIVTVPVEGGEVTELAVVDAELPGIAYFGMGWSGDGSELYYSVHHADPTDPRNGVWVVSAEGGDARPLLLRYQDRSSGPAFLQAPREGGSLLVHDPERMGRSAADDSVYALLDRASGAPTPLVPRLPEAPVGVFTGWAAIAPDGGSVALVVRQTVPDHQVWVRDVGAPDDVLDTPLLIEDVGFLGPVERGLAATWSTNGTLFLTGGGRLNEGTLLTIVGGT